MGSEGGHVAAVHVHCGAAPEDLVKRIRYCNSVIKLGGVYSVGLQTHACISVEKLQELLRNAVS